MPPPPPTKRVISSKPAEIEDITTTSASWEMTEQLPLGRYQYELFKRIGWRRGAVWGLALATAILAARYTQSTAAPPNAPLPTNAPGGRDYAGASPHYAFDPASCGDAIGATDPNCAHVIPPIPVPAVIPPIEPTPNDEPLYSPRSKGGAPDAAQAAPAAVSPSRPQRSSSPARSQPGLQARSSSTHAAGGASPRPRSTDIEDKRPAAKPAAKRSRSTDGAPSNDPFERLDNMRLQ
jgi:hypothetical protein